MTARYEYSVTKARLDKILTSDLETILNAEARSGFVLDRVIETADTQGVLNYLIFKRELGER